MGARVVAIEPDETNQLILQGRFVKFRLARTPVVIVGKAVSDKNMMESMWIDGPGSAVNTLSQKWATTLKGNKARHTYGHCGLDFVQRRTVETTTLEELMAVHGRPLFIKIDVEGYELNVIRGLRHPVPCLSFEVNLPEFRPEGLECVELLGRLAASSKFNYAVDCERGLALEQWLTSDEFLRMLEQCAENTIEVFWKGLASRE
jgi:FkbM family methyltransferase